ncbi:Protein required for 18S rRNA maturation and 40S ribosome biogenesis [Trachipleistophora hominis]|uniref:Protein required for 18S rRNA maturation and 40S ribosome biogenesis n=1 Tax=Trachipleistophora hominis TaxID=72359 RepID=L7JW66_TRAHO|nr:Protein required for 18S rRNA maturation and 40S ribosome biogenesis [Trachipleistophora hominis]
MIKKIIFFIQEAPFTGTEKHKVAQSRPAAPPRPDITHHILLTIIDSPLYKSNRCKIYVKTVNNILIEINEGTRIPRTTTRFVGLMKDVLRKLKIKDEDKTLMRVVKSKIDFPPGAVKIGMSRKGERISKEHFIANDVVLYVNAKQRGEDVFDDVDVLMKVSDYELSGAAAVGKAIFFIEDILNVF